MGKNNSSSSTSTKTLSPEAAAKLQDVYGKYGDFYNYGQGLTANLVGQAKQSSPDDTYLKDIYGQIGQLLKSPVLTNMAAGGERDIYSNKLVGQGADAITAAMQKAGGSLANSVMGQTIQAGHSPSSSGYISAQGNAQKQMTDSLGQQLTNYYLGQQQAADQNYFNANTQIGSLTGMGADVANGIANLQQNEWNNILSAYGLGTGIMQAGLGGQGNVANTWAGNTGTIKETQTQSGGGWGGVLGGIAGAFTGGIGSGLAGSLFGGR